MNVQDIKQMRNEAYIAGDTAMVAICDEAITGNVEAIEECQRVRQEARIADDDAPGGQQLQDYRTGELIRTATVGELRASIEAAEHDGGSGVIIVDGRSCYVS
jgi:hypothetical protein